MRTLSESTAPSRSFPPVVGRRPRPRVLVLGTLPGQASLAAGQYYAQPQNAFWPIMGALCAAGPEQSYARRLEALKRAGIALWDVLAEAERPGSLDAAIVAGTQRVNDIGALIARNASIELIGFNGRTAAAIFTRAIGPSLGRRVATATLPSTSPAFAAMRRDEKLERWRDVLEPYIAR